MIKNSFSKFLSFFKYVYKYFPILSSIVSVVITLLFVLYVNNKYLLVFNFTQFESVNIQWVYINSFILCVLCGTVCYILKMFFFLKEKMSKVFILLCFPFSICVSILSVPLYNLFCGVSLYGSMIFKYFVFFFLMLCYNIFSSQKYLFSIFRILINCILIVPFMYLFDLCNYYQFYGTIMSLFMSEIILFFIFYKNKKNSLKNLFNSLMKVIPLILIMCIITLILNWLIPIDPSKRVYFLLCVLIYMCVSFGVYLFLLRKFKLLKKK